MILEIFLNVFSKSPLLPCIPHRSRLFWLNSPDIIEFSSWKRFIMWSILYYKITKIVRALWLAERSVCMRVCKHGCGIKMFCFSRANHASTNLEKFSSSKLDTFTLFTHSFVGWNLENRYKESVSIFFRLSWHFKWEKSVFWKASFCKTRTDYVWKTSWTRRGKNGKNFSSNQCHTKSFAFCFGKVIL